MTQEDLLAFYKSPGPFTGLDSFEDEVEGLPCDVASWRAPFRAF
jgi:hypothetical protein